MKKFTTLLASALCLFTFSASAQYYYNAFPNAGTNPGGLNTDPEQPFGAVGVTAADGYTSIIANGQTTLQWSPNQTLPFAFDFDGSPVTKYKVSNSGVLTFDTTATTVPAFANVTIPDNSIPDNSVMVWGLQQSVGSTNDGVIRKTHGTAPNRQHWITFASFSAPGAAGTQWTYWSIVLEETTNKMYLVDQRNYLTPLSLTLGVQVNSTTAYEVMGSPNISSNTTAGGNQSDPLDNTYWEFIPGTRPVNEAELTSIDLNSVESNSSPIAISGSITNKGSDTLKSLILGWSDDGGTTINLDTISFNLATLASANFTHGINWTPAANNYYDVEVYGSMPNGMMDANNSNDSAEARVFVNLGNTVAKNALMEQFTTAVCQFCPDGAYVTNQMDINYSNVVNVSVHSCFGTDGMTNVEDSTICATLGINAAPTGMVDRKLFDGETDVAFGRGFGYPNWASSTWATRSLTQANSGSPVDVTLSGSYNLVTRNVNVNASASFVDYTEPGTIAIGLMLVEDSVIGSGSLYNQINAYNTQAGHPYAGAGNPIVGYPHRRVLRDILPSTWGDQTVIPASYALNTNYNRNFNFTLSNTYDESKMYLVAIVSKFGGTDISQYEVINVERLKLNTIVGIEEEENALENSFKLYPNPTDLPFTNLEFTMESSANVQARITDVTGKLVSIEDFGTMTQGKQRVQLNTAQLENGFYFVNLKVGEYEVSRKISILK